MRRSNSSVCGAPLHLDVCSSGEEDVGRREVAMEHMHPAQASHELSTSGSAREHALGMQGSRQGRYEQHATTQRLEDRDRPTHECMYETADAIWAIHVVATSTSNGPSSLSRRWSMRAASVPPAAYSKQISSLPSRTKVPR